LISLTSCRRRWSSERCPSSALLRTAGRSCHSVVDWPREMERRGDGGLASALGVSGRGRFLALLLRATETDSECGWGTGGNGGRGLLAGAGAGAMAGAAVRGPDGRGPSAGAEWGAGRSSWTDRVSQCDWRKISMFWASSLYCW